MSEQAHEKDHVTWQRRIMRKAGSNTRAAQPWHIGNQAPSSPGTYCGVNVTRYAGDRAVSPVSDPPEGRVCAKCLRQYALGVVLPQGGGASWRRG